MLTWWYKWYLTIGSLALIAAIVCSCVAALVSLDWLYLIIGVLCFLLLACSTKH